MATRRSNASSRTADSARSVGAAETTRTAGSGSPAVSTEAPAAQRRPQAAKGQPAPTKSGPVAVSADTRRAMIAKAAYLRAERRGFVPGSEEDDWLSAEKEVDALLSGGRSIPQ